MIAFLIFASVYNGYVKRESGNVFVLERSPDQRVLPEGHQGAAMSPNLDSLYRLEKQKYLNAK